MAALVALFGSNASARANKFLQFDAAGNVIGLVDGAGGLQYTQAHNGSVDLEANTWVSTGWTIPAGDALYQIITENPYGPRDDEVRTEGNDVGVTTVHSRTLRALPVRAVGSGQQLPLGLIHMVEAFNTPSLVTFARTSGNVLLVNSNLASADLMPLKIVRIL